MSRTSHRATGPSSAAGRSCVVCRAERPQDELLRVGQVDGNLVVGRPARGRSAYVCVSRPCFDRLSAGALSRGLRTRVTVDRERFLEQIHQLAERRVLETVGLARRQGGLVCGVDAAPRRSGLVLAASDLAGRSRERLGEEARAFVDGSTLGRAAGMGWLGAARIAVKRLAEQAAYWLALWYESRSAAAVSATQLPAGGASDRQLEVADG